MATTRRGRAVARERAETRQYERRTVQMRMVSARQRAARALAVRVAEQRLRLRSREWAWRREIEQGRSRDLIAHLNRVAPQILKSKTLWADGLPLLHLLVSVEKRWGWVRPLETWTPRARSVRRQRESLTRHLLLEYPVPEFLKPALSRFDPTWTRVAIVIGRGNSLLKQGPAIEGLPPLNRAIVRAFVQSSREFSPWQALRRAQVLSLGGSELLARRAAGSSLAGSAGNEVRWVGALAWYVRVSDRFPRYLFERWVSFVASKFDDDDGWSLAGRDPREVASQICRFEAELRKREARSDFPMVFPESELHAWRVETVDPDGRASRWWFRQIRTGRDLFYEGERMGHCIFSYRDCARRGAVSIWSLSLDGKPILTIEVTDGQVNEVRGRFNRTAERAERSIIGQWASGNQLRVSREAHVD